DASRYRTLGWTYLVLLTIFMVLEGKNYYVAPAYPMLFASGATFFEKVSGVAWKRLWFAYALTVLLSALVLAPLTSPVLPVESYLRYQRSVGLEPIRAENQPTGPLPQYFADEFGWEDMTREVARIYNSLPPDQRASTAIFANSYGQAGAIDFFGPKYG